MAKPRSYVSISGGGSRGALFPRVLEFIENTTEIVGGGGTSVGALEMYAVATHNTAELEPVFRNLEGEGSFMRPDLPFDGFHTLKPMRKLMEEKRWGLPKREMYVGLTYWAEGTHRLVHCNDRPIEDVLDLAIGSSSIAGIHNVMKFGEHFVGDGGHVTSLPPMPEGWKYWMGLDEVHILSAHPNEPGVPQVEESEVNGPVEQLTRFAEIQVHRAMLESLAYYRTLAEWHTDVAFYFYAPRSWADVGPAFTKDKDLLHEWIDRRLEHGDWMARHRIRL